MQKQPSSVPNLHDLTAQTLPPRTRSVLVLEDDVAFAEMLSLFLESHSFEVFCVPNGVEGLRKVTERDFDVIVCDLSMPNLPGDMFYLAVERVRKHLTKRRPQRWNRCRRRCGRNTAYGILL